MVIHLLSSLDEDDSDEDDSDDEPLEEGVPYEQLRPTYTHEGIYKIFQMGLIKHVISQNGDGLHGLSGFSSDELSELHGNVFLEKCEKCTTIYERDCYVLDDYASSYFEELNEEGATDIKKPRNAKQCATCGLTHRTGKKCINMVIIQS
jgi:mono-ADP-ribosyltransferase sirtuin 6